MVQTNDTFEYRVSGIFIWNGGSWDVQGLYPESTTSEGSYRDPETVKLISDHNQERAKLLLANGFADGLASRKAPTTIFVRNCIKDLRSR